MGLGALARAGGVYSGSMSSSASINPYAQQPSSSCDQVSAIIEDFLARLREEQERGNARIATLKSSLQAAKHKGGNKGNVSSLVTQIHVEKNELNRIAGVYEQIVTLQKFSTENTSHELSIMGKFKAEKYNLLASEEMDKFDAELAALAQRPTQAELVGKSNAYHKLTEQLRTFKQEVDKHLVDVNNSMKLLEQIVGLPEATEEQSKSKRQKIEEHITPSQTSLLAQRASLAAAYEKLCEQMPQKFLRLVELLDLYKAVHGAQKAPADPNFARAGTYYCVPRESVAKLDYDMFTQAEILAGYKGTIETLWAEIDVSWKKSTDAMQKGVKEAKEGRLLGVTDYFWSFGRSDTDANEVKSVSVPPLLYERPKTTSGSWFSWGSSAASSKPEAAPAAVTAASSTPVEEEPVRISSESLIG